MGKSLLIVGVGLVLLSGCQKPAAPVQPTQEYSNRPDLFSVDPAAEVTSSSGTGPSLSANTAAPKTAKPAAPSPAAPAAAGKTHTVVKGDTLYSLAKQYYNDPKRWTTIRDANREVLGGKDSLKVGQVLRIP